MLCSKPMEFTSSFSLCFGSISMDQCMSFGVGGGAGGEQVSKVYLKDSA
jgi:hypothetical protein